MIGVAFSGDIDDTYSLNTYVKRANGEIIETKIRNFLDEYGYMNLLTNSENEEISDSVSNSAIILNRILRPIDERQRPILLSILILSIFKAKDKKLIILPNLIKQTILKN